MWTGSPGSSVSLYSTAGPVTGPDFCRALPDSQNLPATTLSVSQLQSLPGLQTGKLLCSSQSLPDRQIEEVVHNSKSCIVPDLPFHYW